MPANVTTADPPKLPVVGIVAPSGGVALIAFVLMLLIWCVMRRRAKKAYALAEDAQYQLLEGMKPKVPSHCLIAPLSSVLPDAHETTCPAYCGLPAGHLQWQVLCAQ